MRRFFSELPPPGWLVTLSPLFLAFFYLPLAFGGTTPETVLLFDGALALAFLFWVFHLVLTQRFPKLPGLCLGAGAVLILLGISHFLNPSAVFVRDLWKYFPLDTHILWLPGSVDKETTAPIVRHFAALAMAFVVLLDAVRHSRVRWFLIRAVALAGLLIACIGIVQRASGAESMLWVGPDQSGKLFFGAFRYNANAAAFLNLSWPAALALWLRSRASNPGNVENAINFCVLFFLVLAVLVNTSKAGQILGLAGAMLATWYFWSLIKPENISKIVVGVLSILFACLFVIALLPALTLMSGRWEATSESLEGRLLLYEVSTKIFPNSGWFGTGPGTFKIIFPFYTDYLGDRLKGVYSHAHQDYLQTVIEWGYLGFAAWVVLIGGGLFLALRRSLQMRAAHQVDISGSCSVLALILVLLHALADFPLQIPAVQWLVTFHLAICWMAASSRKRSPRRHSHANSPTDDTMSSAES